MVQEKELSAKGVVIFSFLTLPLIALYYEPFREYLQYVTAPKWLYAVMFITCLPMWNWRVGAGEIGHVLILGFDTGWRVGPGNYLMPALCPFLRALGIIIGVSVEVPSDHHEGNMQNVQIRFDQRVPIQLRHAQGGWFSQMMGNFFLWLLDLHHPNGKLKFYKVGGIGYAICWGIAVWYKHKG